jgi:hypothetical protein
MKGITGGGSNKTEVIRDSENRRKRIGLKKGKEMCDNKHGKGNKVKRRKE